MHLVRELALAKVPGGYLGPARDMAMDGARVGDLGVELGTAEGLMNMTHDMVDMALAYAKNGYRVFPCAEGSKEPLGRLAPHGCLDATDDEAQIRAWWADEPSANIGVATGNGLVVIDVDYDPVTGLDGYQTLADLEAELGPLPKTFRVQTPRGGMHIYLQFPADEQIPNSSGSLGPGIDVRSDGGYVIGFGSKIGTVYYTHAED